METVNIEPSTQFDISSVHCGMDFKEYLDGNEEPSLLGKRCNRDREIVEEFKDIQDLETVGFT